MSDRTWNDAVQRLLEMLGDRLESYLEGDDTALETLGESIEQGSFTTDDVQAVILVLRSMTSAMSSSGQVFTEVPPDRDGLRVPSEEERASLGPDAWGYLLDLRRRGSLDPEQFERVVEILTGSGVRPVGVELVRDVAARVALETADGVEQAETASGDFDRAH
jgi:uncharacterized protein Smg (DUF494 family)